MDFLYQFDEKYVPFAGVSILSLLENNREADRIRIFVLETGVSDRSRELLTATVREFDREILFLKSSDLEEEIRKLKIPSYRGSLAANMRLFADQVIPEDCSRLLYLDSDTIVCSSLAPLFSMDLQGHPIGMVQDSLVRAHKADIGMDPEGTYFNSGMILYDLPVYREKHCRELLVEHVTGVRSSYPNPDQDLLNVVFHDLILPIHPRYNFQPVHRAFGVGDYYRVYGVHGYYEARRIEEAAADPGVLHFFRFVGQFPWHENSMHPDREAFLAILRRSRWRDMPLWPDEGGIVFRMERILYRVLPRLLFLWIFHQSHEIFTKREDRKSKG